MNERIQELLIEAHKQTNGGIYNGHLSEWTEKFAELIIRECLRISRDNKVSLSESSELCYNDGVSDCILMIRKHFGVE